MADTYFYREKKERNYTVISNVFLRDDRLSLKAKGLMAYLLSLPDDWNIYLTEIVKHSTDGISALRAAIKELTECGYLTQNRTKNEDGTFNSYVYHIIENPVMDNPVLENPVLENQPLLSTHTTKDVNKENTNNAKSGFIQPKSKKELNQEMFRMIYAYTTNEEIQEALTKYLSFRLTRKLTPEQWKIILDNLRQHTNSDADLALDLIRNALAGNYMQIVPYWLLNKPSNSTYKKSFDNTSTVDISESEDVENQALDEEGNPIEF